MLFDAGFDVKVLEAKAYHRRKDSITPPMDETLESLSR